MAARDTGDVRIRLNGDRTAAQQYIGVARTQLGILKELMGFNNLPQLSRTVRLGNGTVIHCQSVFGQETITITPAVRVVAPVEEGVGVEEEVNKVVDYVGVTMPNPVPYRGVSIGVVNRGAPSIVNNVTVDGAGIRHAAWTIYNSAGATASAGEGTLEFIGTGGTYPAVLASYPFLSGYPAGSLKWVTFTGTATNDGLGNITYSGVWTTLGYEELLAADIAAGTGGVWNYVMTSDGEVLASEVQTTTGGHTYYSPDPIWNGDNYVNMYVDSVAGTPDHQLAFIVPEDCVYPAPTTPSTSFTARRKAWFLKNTTELMAALKGKFQPSAVGVTRAELQTGVLPASWDYQIKTQIAKDYNTFTLADGSKAGRHTRMPIVMSITSADDVVVSDTSTGLTQAGTMVTRRTTTYLYTDAKGKVWSAVIDGLLTQVVTQHVLNGSNVYTTRADTYSDWYTPTVAPANESLITHQFILDREVYGVGLLWNGTVVHGYKDTSAYGVPGNPLSYVGYTPAYPTYSNTLVGTAPNIFLQYHNTVLPTYVSNTAQSSTVMNNSAMYHVKQVELKLFGPAPGGVPLGIFVDPTDADGATQLAYYGKALFSFDWFTGAITPMGWAPHVNAQGKEVPLIIDMPAGYSYKNESGVLYFRRAGVNYTPAYNCALGYVWETPDEMWPDVAEYLRAKIKQLISGGGDQVLYKVILA